MAILEADGMVKYYGRRKVVDGVSFEVNLGEVVGLLGPNGAGKTTSFRMVTGQITPFAGKVTFDGNEVTNLPMYKRARLGMGYLSQEKSVFRKLSVEQNILAILEMMPKSRSLGRRLKRKERYDRTDQVLEQFGLTHVRKNSAGRLSGGETRRLEIARCLVCEPSLILLDEPFTGIDPPTIADIQQIVRGLIKQGIGILVTDHRAREILMVTDRIYIIKSGKVRTTGTPQQIIRDPVAINEYLGEGFTENPFGGIPNVSSEAPQPMTTQLVKQEEVRELIEHLKAPIREARNKAVQELVSRGTNVLLPLLEALERSDAEMRMWAFQVVQTIMGGNVTFDHSAPEALRREQLHALKQQVEYLIEHRRAG